jgi:hypothetical protein
LYTVHEYLLLEICAAAATMYLVDVRLISMTATLTHLSLQ